MVKTFQMQIYEEEEIVILPPIERDEPKPIAAVMSQMTKTKDLHTICLTVYTVKQNLDESDQTSDGE